MVVNSFTFYDVQKRDSWASKYSVDGSDDIQNYAVLVDINENDGKSEKSLIWAQYILPINAESPMASKNNAGYIGKVGTDRWLHFTPFSGKYLDQACREFVVDSIRLLKGDNVPFAETHRHFEIGLIGIPGFEDFWMIKKSDRTPIGDEDTPDYMRSVSFYEPPEVGDTVKGKVIVGGNIRIYFETNGMLFTPITR